jgi:hypothetical protein
MKYQEIQDQKHEIQGNTLLKIRNTLILYILLFLLGYMKCQTL